MGFCVPSLLDILFFVSVFLFFSFSFFNFWDDVDF